MNQKVVSAEVRVAFAIDESKISVTTKKPEAEKPRG